MTDSEEVWFSLIERLKERAVVAVVGPELLAPGAGGSDAPGFSLYDLVAADVLAANQLQTVPAKRARAWVHFDAVARVMVEKAVPGVRLRRTVARAIVQRANAAPMPPALLTLAAIDAFGLIVSLTSDNLMERALREALPAVEPKVACFSPRSATSTTVDLPPLGPGQHGVFQLFGSAASLTDFVIHEEDALEYLYALLSEAGRRLPNIMAELRRKDILFIGCDLPDWLGRSLLRLVNDDRLYAKSKQEFLCDGAGDSSLTTFVSRFSPNTLVFPGGPQSFMEQLATRWQAEKSHSAATPAGSVKTTQTTGPTVFVSYASENREAARRIADALCALGFSDVWLDQKKLIAGDSWSHRIDDAIEGCDYFMPLLSRQADGRREGVFWEEWRKALARANRIQDEFILPIGVDDELPARAGYKRIAGAEFAAFYARHLVHAPQGMLDDESRHQLTERAMRFTGA